MILIMNMDQTLLTQLKKQLLEEKAKIESDIGEVAEQNHKSKGKSRWLIRLPFFGKRQTAEQDENADQVEEYIEELSVERQLETRVSDIDSALSKMENGTYGKCEKCGKEIEEARLKVNPEARTHTKC